MQLEYPKFLELSHDKKILTPLKSFSDSLLFYFIGSLALEKDGDLLEIGYGGSTYVLYELSRKFKKLLTVCDLKETCVNKHLLYYDDAIVNTVVDYSHTLPQRNINPIIYSHVDGDKNYHTTKSDLEFCINNLAPNGIICQDDYGNNKWPSIVQAVLSLVAEDKIKIIVVGDSSVWLTKPEYYDYWMNLLSDDREFGILKSYLGMQEASEILDCNPNYFFINTLNYAPKWSEKVFESYETIKNLCSEEELDILKSIHTFKDSPNYLKMPYYGQSSPGIWLK